MLQQSQNCAGEKSWMAWRMVISHAAYLRDSAIRIYSRAFSSTFSMHILSLWQEDKDCEPEAKKTQWMSERRQQGKLRDNLPQCKHSTYVIKFHYVWNMILLLQFLLPLQQRVHAVVTAADLFVVLLFQDGGHAAQAGDAAPSRAHPAASAPGWWRLGLTEASRHAQGLSSPINELLCLNRLRNMSRNDTQNTTSDSETVITYGPWVGGWTPCTSCTWWIRRADSGVFCSGCWTCFRNQDRMGHRSHSPKTLQTSRWLHNKENIPYLLNAFIWAYIKAHGILEENKPLILAASALTRSNAVNWNKTFYV